MNILKNACIVVHTRIYVCVQICAKIGSGKPHLTLHYHSRKYPAWMYSSIFEGTEVFQVALLSKGCPNGSNRYSGS